MTKKQQTLWLAGFTGVSAACIISFLNSDILPVERPSALQPHALLAANADQDKLVTLSEVRKMLDGHFARLDTDKDGLINPNEYADRHIQLFSLIDADSNQKLTPSEVRHHNLKGLKLNENHQIQNLVHKTTY